MFKHLGTAIAMLATVACGGGTAGTTLTGVGVTATLGEAEFDCKWLIEQWHTALAEAGGRNTTTYEDYKPALLVLAKEMETKGDPPYIWGDADRVLRQCSDLEGYPPWN